MLPALLPPLSAVRWIVFFVIAQFSVLKIARSQLQRICKWSALHVLVLVYSSTSADDSDVFHVVCFSIFIIFIVQNIYLLLKSLCCFVQLEKKAVSSQNKIIWKTSNCWNHVWKRLESRFFTSFVPFWEIVFHLLIVPVHVLNNEVSCRLKHIYLMNGFLCVRSTNSSWCHRQCVHLKGYLWAYDSW